MHRSRIGWAAAIAGVWVAAGSPAATAQPVYDLPHSCLAWWAVDPSSAGGGVGTSPARLAAAVAAVVTASEQVGDRSPALGAALLASSVQCGLANRVVLLDVAGTADGRTGKWACERLELVIEVVGEWEEFGLAIVSAIGVESGSAGSRGERLGWVGEGTNGVGFTIARGDSRLRVEVAVGDGWTRVGLGEGVLQRWLEAGGGPAERSELLRAVRGQRSGRMLLEAAADLDGLRRAAPDRFSQGRVGRLLAAVGLANARDFSIGVAAGEDTDQGRAVAASWGSRSLPMDHATGWASPEAKIEAPEGERGWSVRLEAPMNAMVGRALGVARAWRTRFGATEFDRALERWSQDQRSRGALNVIRLGAVGARLGVGAGGRLHGSVRLPGSEAGDVEAAIRSLPGAREEEPLRWSIPVLNEREDPGGMLRTVDLRIVRGDDAIDVEFGVVEP